MDAMDRVNNYKLNESLKKGEAETPKEAEGQAEGGANINNMKHLTANKTVAWIDS